MTSIVEPDVSWTAQKLSLHKMVLDVREKLSKYKESVGGQSSAMCCQDPDEDVLPRHSPSTAPKNVAKDVKKKKLLKEKSTSITLKQGYQEDCEITKNKILVSKQMKKSPLKNRTVRSDTQNRKVDQRTATKWVVSVSNNVIKFDRSHSHTKKTLLVRKYRETPMLQQNSPWQQKNIKNYFSSKQAKLLQKTEPKIVTNKKSSIPTNSNALSRATMKSALNGNYESAFPLYYSSALVKRAKAGTLLLGKSVKTPYQKSASYNDPSLEVPPSTCTHLFEEQNKNVLNKRVTPETNLPRRGKFYEGCWLWQSVDKTTNSRGNGKQLSRSLRYNQMYSGENTEDDITSRFRRTCTIPDAVCGQPIKENYTTSEFSTPSSSRSSTKPGYEDEYVQKYPEAAKHINFDDNNVEENQNVEPCRSRISTIKGSTPEDDHKRTKKVRSVQNTNILRNAIRRSTPRKMKRKNIFHLKARLNNDLEQNPNQMGDGCHHVQSQKRNDIVIENTMGDIKEIETTDSAEYSNAKVFAKQNSKSTRVFSTNTFNLIINLKRIYALLRILELFSGFCSS